MLNYHATATAESHVEATYEDTIRLPFWECPACGRGFPDIHDVCPVCGVDVSKYFKVMESKPVPREMIEQEPGTLLTSPVFWLLVAAGFVPFMHGSISFYVFCFFTAFCWGIVFKKLVAPKDTGWLVPILAMLFTATVGIQTLLWSFDFLPRWYMKMPYSRDALASLMGYTCRVGFMEELVKIAPVLMYIGFKRMGREDIDPRMVVLVGMFSALGFSAEENVDYAERAINDAQKLVAKSGESKLTVGVMGAMKSYSYRPLVCVLMHAVWAGLFSYYIALATKGEMSYTRAIIAGLGITSLLHGLYDWFPGFTRVIWVIVSVQMWHKRIVAPLIMIERDKQAAEA